ncbi:unnamed protein product [Lasius platythorax]|uniref:Uncharacterized protein n=1 Tax=Lasius platythorax TaxID=488582 RepID=A0AAV2MXS7_9HYME
MQHIASASGDPINKSPRTKNKFDKSKDDNNNDRHSGRSDVKDQRAKPDKDRYCSFCHRRNHIKEDCYKLKRKEGAT